MQYRLIKPFTETYVPYFKSRPILFWSSAFVAATAVTVIVGLAQGEVGTRYIGYLSILNIGGILLIPIGLRLCLRLVLDWARSLGSFVSINDPDRLKGWYNHHLSFFEGSRVMVLVATVWACVALFAYKRDGFFDPYGATGQVWAAIVLFVAAFLAGCGLWAMVAMARAVHRLGVEFSGVIVVTDGRFGILSTGRMLAQCWAIIGVIWFVYVLSAVHLADVPATLQQAFLNNGVVFMALPSLPMVIISFFGAQISLHEAMLQYKRSEVSHLEHFFRKAKPDDLTNIPKEKQELIEFLQKQLHEAEKLPEWPFTLGALFSVSRSVAITLLPILLKAMLALNHLT